MSFSTSFSTPFHTPPATLLPGVVELAGLASGIGSVSGVLSGRVSLAGNSRGVARTPNSNTAQPILIRVFVLEPSFQITVLEPSFQITVLEQTTVHTDVIEGSVLRIGEVEII